MADSFKLINPNVLQIEANRNNARHPLISIRCPHCKIQGTFHAAPPTDLSALSYTKSVTSSQGNRAVSEYIASLGICPNQECKGIVLFVTSGGKAKLVMPPELLDFSIDGLPSKLAETLDEAAKCHSAGAYRAAAMMVRRLLEEICEESKATGKDLHSRLQTLKTKIVLPEVLFEAMNELKALGNDAAHIEAKAYDSIGKEEAENSIELAKEILKALYQLQGLVGRLQARKKPAS